LFPAPGSLPPGSPWADVSYDDLVAERAPVSPLSAAALGDLLRHALGLSAWKGYQTSRWPLRVNPSSGNLHPTEAYVVCGPLAGLAAEAAVYHYAADAHALERRCTCDAAQWQALAGGDVYALVALTSIHWREAWKYGERAFRYCQHDLGHAMAAVSLGAALHGWHARLLPTWSHRQIASLTGLDRDDDFFEAEREEPGCLLAIMAKGVEVPPGVRQAAGLLDMVARGQWTGRASQLSEDHVEWSFIDEIATATEDPGHDTSAACLPVAPPLSGHRPSMDARALFLQRRSAVSFDGTSGMDAATFFALLSRVMPAARVPWSTLWWTPAIHLLLFVHRVDGVAPGLYLLCREPESGRALQASLGRDVPPAPAHDVLPLVCLAAGDCRAMARRLSCDQDIASDGCFSLGMIAAFDGPLAAHGPSFYRNLFWEAGVVGHMLYLEAEAIGVRGTGIGCFYDDGVHDVVGLSGHEFQSLYHFTVGIPVEDRRLRTEPGYPWEAGGAAFRRSD
jgi:SagB-type dehydrogenase family enzyme